MGFLVEIDMLGNLHSRIFSTRLDSRSLQLSSPAVHRTLSAGDFYVGPFK